MKLQKVAGTYLLPYIIKPQWGIYLLFLIILGPWVIMGIPMVLKEPTFENAWPTLGTALLLGILLKFIASFEIILLQDKIIYKTPFFRIKEVLYSDISELKIKIGTEILASGKQSGFYTLHICRRSFRETLAMDLTLFSRKNWAIIVDAIVAKTPSVEIDEFTKGVKESDFKPISFESRGKFWQFVWWLLLFYLAFFIVKLLIRKIRWQL